MSIPATIVEPVARVQGQPYGDLPDDLYIPPDALEVFLETFEGPLDLLLYLIRRQNLDILDIPVALVTRQYMEYIQVMCDLRLELAGEYLAMSAILAEIKSRMLLPRHAEEEEEDDPRAELVRRLQEYERFRHAARALDGMARLERDLHTVDAAYDHLERPRPQPDVDLRELLLALAQVMRRAEHLTHHTIHREKLSVRERMSRLLDRLDADGYTEFSSLFTAEEGRMGVVVTLLAVLELVRERVIEVMQNEAYGAIYLRARA